MQTGAQWTNRRGAEWNHTRNHEYTLSLRSQAEHRQITAAAKGRISGWALLYRVNSPNTLRGRLKARFQNEQVRVQ